MNKTAIMPLQEKPDTICNCDPDYCVAFAAVHVLKHDEGIAPSNYRIRTTDETCIGSGVSAYKCPSKSLSLERKEILRDPPRGGREYMRKILSDFGKARARRNFDGRGA